MNRGLLFQKSAHIKVMLACGLIQIAAYYFAGSFASPGKHLAIPQPDTLLYCQSARQVAEGLPFVYTPGDKPSTGSTTHLYPFVLGALYKAGATGDALVTAGFALNAVFYLIFLANWGIIVRCLVTSPRVRLAACALLVLSGHPAYGALSQSDVGFFMAVSSGIFMTLLTGRTGWFAALLIVSPWCRPEGAVLAVFFAAAMAVRRCTLRQRVTRVEWLTAFAAVFSAAGVFAFNFWLTGHAQFQSVLYKGYFKQYDFFTALQFALGDAVRMGKEIFLGIPGTLPREIFFLPVLGALFAWVGVMVRPWRREGVWKEVWWLLSCAAGVGVVASSGWQNTNIDRYLAWLLPVWLVYMAGGAVWVGRKFPRAACRGFPFLAAAVFQALGAVWLVSTYYANCLIFQQSYDFAKEAHTLLPEGARVGGGSCSLAYAMPGRRFVHLSGLYSPDMMTPDLVVNLERLKRQPSLRFDYWELTSAQTVFAGAKIDSLCGPAVTLGADEAQIRHASWDVLDRSLSPMAGGLAELTNGWRRVERCDVGYPEDEKRCAYETGSRFYGTEYEPFALAETNRLFDVGRAVVGWESMSLRLTPHRPLRVVLRTAAKVETNVRTGNRINRQTFTFVSPLKLRIHVDGVEAGVFGLPLLEPAATPAFSEVSFTLPAERILRSPVRLTVYGDHASFGYWFYQPE